MAAITKEAIRPVVLGSQRAIVAGVVECLVSAGLDFSIVTFSNGTDYRAHPRCVNHARVPARNLARPDPAFAQSFAGHLAEIGGNVIVPTGRLSCMALSAMHQWLPQGCVFPIAGPELLRMLDNKWEFARFLGASGIATPRTWLIRSPPAIPTDLPFPLIGKPPALGGGYGIVRLDDMGALRRVCSAPGHSFPFLVQEFIPGTDIDISVLAVDGKIAAYSIQKWASETVLEFVAEPGPLNLAQRIVARCGLSGVAHFDMRLDERDGTLYVIECNPRFWATVGASLRAGVNFPVEGARIALCGELVSGPAPRPCRVYVGDVKAAVGPEGQMLGARGLVVNR